ncbi:MAG: thioredoxin family protein [Acidobacteria bacterium]|nr:thioredoxin family protein [Acidobacteriota bacterium]
MSRTPSTMLELGTIAPAFELIDTVSGQTVSIDTFAGKKGLLVMFICNHCPFVKHVNDELVRLGENYVHADVGVVAINSNDADNYPADAPDKMKANAEALGYKFPYLYDSTQAVAKAYAAACTPDFYLFDEDRKLVYRGQLDDSRPENDIPVSGKDLRGAIEALLSGGDPSADQKPSIGCNIKWKPGAEPQYGKS